MELIVQPAHRIILGVSIVMCRCPMAIEHMTVAYIFKMSACHVYQFHKRQPVLVADSAMINDLNS